MVTIPGTVHDLSSEFPGWLSMRAPRVLQEVEGDFVVQVKVSGEFAPRSEPAIPGFSAWIGTGLLLWDGDKNFLRLEVFFSGGPALGTGSSLWTLWRTIA